MSKLAKQDNDSTADIAEYCLYLADDALVLGQRLTEWCSQAPTLEEDIAMANIALDFIGRARLLFGYSGELTGSSEDQLAYMRNEREYTNLLINELPIGDFAFTIMRQYLIDEFDGIFFSMLSASKDSTLAAIAQKAVKECRYHLRRSRDWLLCLGDGSEESHRRIQTALNTVWDYSSELFEMRPLEVRLLAKGIAVDRNLVAATWRDKVIQSIEEATLVVPDLTRTLKGGRQGLHTENLGFLLAEMQVMQRNYPNLDW